MIPKLGIVMDPIQGIHPQKDSSFALLLAATRRGWPIFYMEASDLALSNQGPQASIRPLKVWDNPKHWFTLGPPSPQPLCYLQVILMRQDPPVSRAYLHVTQILTCAEQRGVLVINHPQTLRDANEKLLALQFPDCCPPTLVTQSLLEANLFLTQHQDVIVKPLDGMGGQSIFRLRLGDPNKQVIFETLLAREEQYFLIQRYIPEIIQGDKRILMIYGEPVPYALARIPAAGETRANLAAGGRGIATPLTDQDYWICQQIRPYLQEKGLVLVGLDVIGRFLTEINITSPTCIRELEMQCNLKISDQIMDYIETTLK